jgi:hypothetical protein
LTLKDTNKGFVLTETLISIAIDTCLLAIFFLIFTLFWNVFTDQNQKAQFYREAYTVQAYLKSDINKALEISVSPTEINLDNNVSYQANEGCLYRNNKPLAEADLIIFEKDTIGDNMLVTIFLQKKGIKLYINAGNY